MIAALLTDETLTLENLPRLADVSSLVRILGNHGVDYSIDGRRPGEATNSGQTVHLTADVVIPSQHAFQLCFLIGAGAAFAGALVALLVPRVRAARAGAVGADAAPQGVTAAGQAPVEAAVVTV